MAEGDPTENTDPHPRVVDHASTWVLGLNAWLTAGLLPTIFSASPRAYAALPVPLALLAVGLTRRARRGTLAAWLLLAAVPATLCLTASLADADATEPPFSPLSLAIAAGSLLAYLAVAAAAAGPPLALRSASARPLTRVSILPPSRARTILQRALLTVIALGAMVSALYAAAAGADAWAVAWGVSERAARTFAVITAATVGVIGIAGLYGPALRRPRRAELRTRRAGWRVASLVFTALLFGVSYLVLALDPAP